MCKKLESFCHSVLSLAPKSFCLICMTFGRQAYLLDYYRRVGAMFETLHLVGSYIVSGLEGYRFCGIYKKIGIQMCLKDE